MQRGEYATTPPDQKVTALAVDIADRAFTLPTRDERDDAMRFPHADVALRERPIREPGLSWGG